MNKKRVDWIDLCKFIAISAVVWGHVGLPKTFDIYIHDLIKNLCNTV